MAIRVIPVIDLKARKVVRAIAGRREDYRPITSCLTCSSRPLDVARSFRNDLGLNEIYIADLDAIAGQAPAYDVFGPLSREGFQLLVDAAVQESSRAQQMRQVGAARVVIGLETLPTLDALAAILQTLGPAATVFSLDLRDGKPLASGCLGRKDPLDIAETAIHMGVTSLIVLDLAHVGMSAGTGTGELCGRLREAHPDLEIIAGGGIQSMGNVRQLEQVGVSAVLIASALHDGVIGREDLIR